MSTTMTEEDVMRKIGSLLRHIEVNTNPNEVAIATQKLQRYMTEWNITEAQIAERENRPAPNIMLADRLTYSTQKALCNWQLSLLDAVTKAYFGKCINHPKTPQATVIAEKMNLIAIKAVYTYLRDEVLRLESIAYKDHVAQATRPQHHRGFWNQFGAGASHEIRNRLQEQSKKDAAEFNGVNALIVLKDKLIQSKVQEVFGTLTKGTPVTVNYSSAYYAGKRAGSSVPLKPGARQLT